MHEFTCEAVMDLGVCATPTCTGLHCFAGRLGTLRWFARSGATRCAALLISSRLVVAAGCFKPQHFQTLQAVRLSAPM